MWIQENLPKLNVKVCQGIGGSLDAITGETKRGPLLCSGSSHWNGSTDLLLILKEYGARPLSPTSSSRYSHKNAALIHPQITPVKQENKNHFTGQAQIFTDLKNERDQS